MINPSEPQRHRDTEKKYRKNTRFQNSTLGSKVVMAHSFSLGLCVSVVQICVSVVQMD
jgi:hypothetical protein